MEIKLEPPNPADFDAFVPVAPLQEESKVNLLDAVDWTLIPDKTLRGYKTAANGFAAYLTSGTSSLKWPSSMKIVLDEAYPSLVQGHGELQNLGNSLYG